MHFYPKFGHWLLLCHQYGLLLSLIWTIIDHIQSRTMGRIQLASVLMLHTITYPFNYLLFHFLFKKNNPSSMVQYIVIIMSCVFFQFSFIQSFYSFYYILLYIYLYLLSFLINNFNRKKLIVWKCRIVRQLQKR